MIITKLDFFDFDSTLFRSPDQPSWWKESDGDFYRDVISLSEPFVPEKPDQKWWIEHIVRHARESLLHPNTYTVLATGRRGQFRNRVSQLMLQKRLAFDEVHLNPGTETGYYKGTLLFNLVHKFPHLKEVNIWDDRIDLLHAYQDIIASMGFAVKARIADVPPMPTKASARISFRIARKYFQRKRL